VLLNIFLLRRGSFLGISQVVTLFANIYLSHFLTFGFALMASYFSVNSDRKVTKRTPPDQFALRVPSPFNFANGPP
jgi:hypothetical protein